MTKTKAGERLPYLLGKLKTPRVLERLEQTAALAREQQWPYEQFLESLLEAEVFARDASGARMRIRHAAFPALKSLDDFDWSAQPSAERPLVHRIAAHGLPAPSPTSDPPPSGTTLRRPKPVHFSAPLDRRLKPQKRLR